VRGWGVNILEDARHMIGLLQYNLSTVHFCLQISAQKSANKKTKASTCERIEWARPRRQRAGTPGQEGRRCSRSGESRCAPAARTRLIPAWSNAKTTLKSIGVLEYEMISR
jgi:hypothetical protein